jgi:phage-related protein
VAPLATATVRLRLDTSGVKADVDRGIRGAGGEKAARAKGASIGQNFAKGFGDGGNTFTRVAASMAARTTILTAGLAAATPVAAKFVAALAPAAGIVVGVAPAALAAAAATTTLKVAVGGTADAISKGLFGSATQYKKALEGLVPAQAAVTRQVVGFKAQIDGVRQVVAQRFFKPLTDDINPLAQTYLPLARQEMGGLSERLGNLAAQVLATARTTPVVEAVRNVFQATGSAVQGVTGRVGPLMQALARLVSSTMPILRTMTGDVSTLAGRFTVWVNEAAKSGRLVTIFNNARVTIGQLLAILGNLGSIARTVFGYSNTAAGGLLQNLVKLTGQARLWVESTQGATTLTAVFRTLAGLGNALRGTLAGVLPHIAESLQMAAPAATQFATAAGRIIVSLGPLLPAITGVTVQILTALIPAMNRLATWLRENQGLVQALAPLLVGFAITAKAVGAVMAVAGAAAKVWAAMMWLSSPPVLAHDSALRKNLATMGTWIGVKRIEAASWLSSTGATIRDTAAKAANRTATLAHAAAARLSSAALSVGVWLQMTAATVANRAALVATTVATRAHAAATVAWAAIQRAAAAGLAAMRAGVLALNAAMRANPIGAVITVITLLVGALVLLYQRNETVRRVIDAVWRGIRQAIGAVADWFTRTVIPAIQRATDQLVSAWQFLARLGQALWTGIRTVITAQLNFVFGVFNTLRRWITVDIPNGFRFLVNAVRSYINLWRTIITTGWNIVRGIFTQIRNFLVVTLTAAFRAFSTIVGTIWRTWGAGLRAIWDSIRTGSFEPLRRFITQTLPGAFRTGVGAIRAAWDRVRAAAREPVTFVVRSVINPLIRGYNAIARVFRAPEAREITGFARGGQIPGRPSTEDNRLATVMDGGRRLLGNIKVATGEFIVNTRQTMKNLPWLKWANNGGNFADLFGDRNSVDPHLDGAARGGQVGKGGVGDGIGDFFGKIKKAFTGAVGAITDPVGTLKKLANGLLSRIPGGGPIGAVLKGMGTRIVDAIGNFLGGTGGGIGGGAGPGGGSAGMMRFLRARFPGLQLISGFRPGSRTLSGNLSWHARDRAVDVPPIRAVAQYIRSTVGSKALELITPWRELDLLRGRPHHYSASVHNQHNFPGRNAHVHWAAKLGGLIDKLNNTAVVKLMDRGGSLDPGLNMVYNGLGRREDLVRADAVPAAAGGVHFHFHGPVNDQRATEDMVYKAWKALVRDGKIPKGAGR